MMTKKTQTTAQSPPHKTIEVDFSVYDQYLADSDMTDAEKQEFLAALWSIILGFVDLGLGIHPVQLGIDQLLNKHCGQVQKPANKSARQSGSVLKSGKLPAGLSFKTVTAGEAQFGQDSRRK